MSKDIPISQISAKSTFSIVNRECSWSSVKLLETQEVAECHFSTVSITFYTINRSLIWIS